MAEQEHIQKLQKIVSNPVLWIENFMRIRDKSGNIVPFKLTRNQKYFVCNLHEGGNVVLKGRQQGISSVTLALMIYKCSTNRGYQALFMSKDDTSALSIFLKLKELYSLLPESVRPKTQANNRRELMFVNGARIVCTVCSGQDKGRGSTLDFVHISEAGQMPSYLDEQLASIRACIVPTGYLVLESTARGINSFAEIFFEAVRDFKDFEEQKKSNPKAIFTGAYRPFFFNWIRSGNHDIETKLYAERYIQRYGKITQKDLDDEERELFDKHGAKLSQILWRRIKIKEFIGKNSDPVEIFHQEYPTTYLEAFITSGNAIFDNAKILEYIDCAKDKKLLPMPADVDKVIKKYRESINIWRYPDKGKHFLGVDGATGVGGDYTVFTILDETCEQVLEFSSNKIKPYESAALLVAICKWYKQPLLIIENASSGIYLLEHMKNEQHYINLYKQRKGFGKTGKRKVGFDTSRESKEKLISTFQEAFENDKVGINSIQCLEEMEKFQADENGKMEGKGAHDDRVISMALSYEAYKSGMSGRYYV